jgi:hypothetical protein
MPHTALLRALDPHIIVVFERLGRVRGTMQLSIPFPSPRGFSSPPFNMWHNP